MSSRSKSGRAPSAAAIFDPRKAVLLRPKGTANPPGWRSRRRSENPRPPGERYRRDSYAQAVARACKAEGVEPFSVIRTVTVSMFEQRAQSLELDDVDLFSGGVLVSLKLMEITSLRSLAIVPETQRMNDLLNE